MSEIVHDSNIKLDDPRYDQNTYSGRGERLRSRASPLELVLF